MIVLLLFDRVFIEGNPTDFAVAGIDLVQPAEAILVRITSGNLSVGEGDLTELEGHGGAGLVG